MSMGMENGGIWNLFQRSEKKMDERVNKAINRTAGIGECPRTGSNFDQIFCQGCGNPIYGIEGVKCGKCDHEYGRQALHEAIEIQKALCEENKRNKKYVPPERHI